MKITVSIPTRGPAPHLELGARSYIERAEKPDDVRVVVSTDEDDSCWNRERRRDLESEHIVVSRAPREDALGTKWNRAMQVVPADIYLPAGDDALVMTQGWDERIRQGAALFTDGCGVIYYGEAPNAQLPLGQAVTKDWAEGFGGIYPGHFPYWFIDMWLDELALMTGRLVWVDIQVGAIAGRGKSRGLRDLRFWNQFFDLTRPVREAQADAAIEEFCKDLPWMAWSLRGKVREALRVVFQGRSHFIHATSVQQEADLSTDAPEDDRYLRIKGAATKYLESLYKKAA